MGVYLAVAWKPFEMRKLSFPRCSFVLACVQKTLHAHINVCKCKYFRSFIPTIAYSSKQFFLLLVYLLYSTKASRFDRWQHLPQNLESFRTYPDS